MLQPIDLAEASCISSSSCVISRIANWMDHLRHSIDSAIRIVNLRRSHLATAFRSSGVFSLSSETFKQLGKSFWNRVYLTHTLAKLLFENIKSRLLDKFIIEIYNLPYFSVLIVDTELQDGFDEI